MNGSMNKSKSKNESSTNNLRESQFQNRNANSITRSAQRKATPGWGQEKFNAKISPNNSMGMPMMQNERLSKNNKNQNNVEDSAKKNNWLLENMDFIISDNKNI